jgi:SAM-dependent methyltransferase
MAGRDANYIFGLLDYHNARILHVAVGLGIFDLLDRGRLSATSVARRIGTDPGATGLLLNALVALELVMKRGKLYSNRRLAARYLVSRKEEYIGDTAMHGANNWQAWGRLEEVIKTGKPADPSGQRTGDAKRHRDFVLAMHNSSRRKANKIADAIDLRGASALLDVGGGPGTYSIYFCKAHSSLRAYVYDLPETADIAAEVISRYGMGDRVSFIPGDFIRNRIPGEYDVLWVSNIIHSYGPAENRKLMKKLFRATKPGGRIFLQDFILEEDRTGPFFAARFALHMLINTEKGRTYTFSEIRDWLKSAGFTRIGRLDLRLPNDARIIQARRGHQKRLAASCRPIS